MDMIFIVPGVITMSIGATRIYLGLINSATFDNHSVGAVDVDKWATMTQIQYTASSHQSYLINDTLKMGTS
ncbi:hypothetical protein BJV74DRAFT_849795 [Russula compacta]|nr:hypothetical protein BJV74DRAFT_849795 [Russula compacta]